MDYVLSDSDLLDFPRLTWKQLRYLSFRKNQLKQSRSYTQEHLNQSELYSSYVNREVSSVVRFQFRGRSKVYNVWIKIGIGHNPNIEWHCQ
ncbi:potassium voltage-gated channel subfamily KQT member 1 [Trichonephila clavata]|uniref:Potassium voltage-gated channel subfamily KQT member 1 n=1 Tax=Trichonephila clavata TaxID=2740835 RepID=A0A8X6LMP8_TRICU|nr:potassium voltage-gated channel subfamily KQT member 1 [Trichonephila clavata]